MDDRKTQTLVTRLVKAKRDIDEIKDTQPIGSDNTVINMLSTNDAYDLTVTIPGSGTTRLYLSATYFPLDLRPWQIADYSEIYSQTWVGSMSTKYSGTQNTNLIIFSKQMRTSLFANTATWSMNNVSGSNITVYIKFYTISTAMNGDLSFSWSLSA